VPSTGQYDPPAATPPSMYRVGDAIHRRAVRGRAHTLCFENDDQSGPAGTWGRDLNLRCVPRLRISIGVGGLGPAGRRQTPIRAFSSGPGWLKPYYGAESERPGPVSRACCRRKYEANRQYAIPLISAGAGPYCGWAVEVRMRRFRTTVFAGVGRLQNIEVR